MQSKELKKNLIRECPFCGGEAELNYYGSESMPFYSVSCKECGCNQDSSIHKEAVIEAWNKRVNEFDEDKYEKLVLTEMERKHSENQKLLSELKAMLPTTTEAEIKKKAYNMAIDDFTERLRKKCDSVIREEWNNNVQPASWTDAYEDFKDDIDEIAESLKIVCILE